MRLKLVVLSESKAVRKGPEKNCSAVYIRGFAVGLYLVLLFHFSRIHTSSYSAKRSTEVLEPLGTPKVASTI